MTNLFFITLTVVFSCVAVYLIYAFATNIADKFYEKVIFSGLLGMSVAIASVSVCLSANVNLRSKEYGAYMTIASIVLSASIGIVLVGLAIPKWHKSRKDYRETIAKEIMHNLGLDNPMPIAPAPNDVPQPIAQPLPQQIAPATAAAVQTQAQPAYPTAVPQVQSTPTAKLVGGTEARSVLDCYLKEYSLSKEFDKLEPGLAKAEAGQALYAQKTKCYLMDSVFDRLSSEDKNWTSYEYNLGKARIDAADTKQPPVGDGPTEPPILTPSRTTESSKKPSVKKPATPKTPTPTAKK